MKRNCLIIFVVCVILLSSLVGCNKKDPTEISIGKYYLSDNRECYIEISEENKISFVNVDFSPINDSLKQSYGVEINAAELLADVCTYETNEDFDRLYVPLMGEVFITIIYSDTEGTLQLMSKTYYRGEVVE